MPLVRLAIDEIGGSLTGDKTRVATIPVFEERLRIDKTVKEVDRLFIRTSVLERTEYAEVELHSGKATLERLPVNRVVDAPPAIRQEGDTIIIPVVEEIMVVEKRLLLKEEIRIHRQDVVEHIRQPVRLRSEEVSLDRAPSTGLQSPQPKRTEAMSDVRTPMSMETAAGDSGTVVAMFETYDRALAARNVLVSAGIDRSRIEILAESGSAEDVSFHYERNDEGIWGAIKRLFMPDEDTHVYAEGLRRGYAVLVVRVGTGDQEQIISLLESQDAVDVETHATNWRQSGWAGMHEGQAAWQSRRESLTAGTTPTAATARSDLAATGTMDHAQEEVIPVYEEQLRVGKREIGRGSVRVRSYVVEQPVQEQVRLREEHIEVERRPVDRPADTVVGTAEPFRERTIEVSATAEEAVVAKEARIKEEVVVRKEAEERTEIVSDTVRHTEVEVDDDRTAAPKPSPKV